MGGAPPPRTGLSRGVVAHFLPQRNTIAQLFSHPVGSSDTPAQLISLHMRGFLRPGYGSAHALAPAPSLLLVALALAGCGGSDGSSGGVGAGADPAQAIPAGAPVYVEAVVRPEGEQGDNARALLERFRRRQDARPTLLDEALSGGRGPDLREGHQAVAGRARSGIGVTDLAADEPGFVGAVAVTDAREGRRRSSSRGRREGGRVRGLPALPATTTRSPACAGDFVAARRQPRPSVKRASTPLEGDCARRRRGASRTRSASCPRSGSARCTSTLEALRRAAEQDPDLDPAGKARSSSSSSATDAEPITARADRGARQRDDRVPRRRPRRWRRSSSLGLLGGESHRAARATRPPTAFAVLGFADVGKTLKDTHRDRSPAPSAARR